MSPNLVEPLENIMEAETNSVWNSWAVRVPVIIASPSTCNFADGEVVPIPTKPDEPSILIFVVPVGPASLKSISPLELLPLYITSSLELLYLITPTALPAEFANLIS